MSVSDIAPPFSDEHSVKVMLEIVLFEFNEVNSKTLPFPLSRLIELKVFVPLSVSFPALTSISALLLVAYVELLLMVIPFNTRLAVDVMEMREISLVSCPVTLIVNDFRVCSPPLADSMHSPLLTSTIVDVFEDSQNVCIVTLEETLNPVFDEE